MIAIGHSHTYRKSEFDQYQKWFEIKSNDRLKLNNNTGL